MLDNPTFARFKLYVNGAVGGNMPNSSSALERRRTALHESLAAAVGAEQIVGQEAMAKYNRDWTGDHTGSAFFVVRPRTVQQVASAVRWCREHQERHIARVRSSGR